MNEYRKGVLKLNLWINTRKHVYMLASFDAPVTEVEGFTSDVYSGKGEHVIFWDFEAGINKEKAIHALSDIQWKKRLGDIHIFQSGDRESYRAICCEVVPLKDMVTVIRLTEFMDIAFIKWTMIRRAATIRLSPKQGEPIKYVCTLAGYFNKTYSLGHSKILNSLYDIPMPERLNDVNKIKWVRYETTNLAPTLEHQGVR